MRYKKLKLSALFLLVLGLTGIQAQESVNATGGNASGSGGSASYSVGQLVYTTNTGTNGSVTQGVQQQYEISALIGTEEFKAVNLLVSIYPNPSTEFLTIEVQDFEFSTLNFQLYNIQGKLLQSEKITSKQTRIVVGHLMPSTYFVKLRQGHKEVKTFQIIKTH